MGHLHLVSAALPYYVGRMKAIILSLFLLPGAAMADCVVLLHGLARTENSMRIMEETLSLHGLPW